ncbi:MAG: hypothetical protein K2Q45_03910 [Nitrosomonas sp.]|nr:hypothetical protein [Nitrosomonas sp.]
MRTKRVSHSEGSTWLYDTIKAFYEPLKRKQLPSIEAIVFSCGTLVRLDCTEEHHKPVHSFVTDEKLDEFLEQDFPEHRFPADGGVTYETTRAENEQDFQWSQTTAFPKQCAKAYGCLMWSGYPLPGGMGADRLVIPWEAASLKSLSYMTIFQHLGPCCCTLTEVTDVPQSILQRYGKIDETDPESLGPVHHDSRVRGSVDYDSADRRRIDYMFPIPYAYVDKNYEIHVL